MALFFRPFVIAILLLLLNIITKIIFITDIPISLDEPFTIYHAQFGIKDLVDSLNGYNNPPLYEMILHYWIKLFGISPLSVRFLPMLFASFSAIALYFFCLKYFSKRTALISSLLLTFSSLLIQYSHTTRVYSLFLLLTVLSMHYYLEVINATTKRKFKIVIFIAVSTLLIYAHYFGVIVLFIQFVHCLVFFRRGLKPFLLTGIIITALYIPQILTVYSRMMVSVSEGTWVLPPSGIESLYNMLWAFCNMPIVVVLSLILLLTGIIVSFINKNIKQISPQFGLILLWFVIPFFGMFAISYKVPMYLTRYLIFAIPSFYILVTLSVEVVFKREMFRTSTYGIIILAFASTVDLNKGNKFPIDKVVNEIIQLKGTNTAVIVKPYDELITSFAYHYNINHFKYIIPGNEYGGLEEKMRSENIFFTMNDKLGINLPTYQKVLIFWTGDKLNPLEHLLQSDFQLIQSKEWQFNHFISLYQRK
ncbi:MAG: glycosyltransferase family 39 protein [Bacteroidia bacterium]|nr:glycosyltransferase family 39 protein [Bacteroidia bacterium]